MKLKLLTLTLLLALLSNVPLAFAQEGPEPSEVPTPTILPVSASNVAAAGPVEYDLPFPGLLPDHSFYFFKAARDKIMSIMISNPVKKAEFNLLQADKQVQAAYLLIMRGKNKYVLAESTFSKGLTYFEQSVNNAVEAKKEGMDNSEVTLKLSLANMKYLEIIKEIQDKVGKDEAKKFERNRLRVVEWGKRVKELRP